MRELTGRTALVTGASRGLGRRIARELAAEGMNLVLAARGVDELKACAEELKPLGTPVAVAPADVASAEALARLATEAERSFGGVDVLVNNAGIEIIYAFHEMPLEAVERMIRVNLLAAMTLARHLLPGMLARGRGHIVNISSLAGKSGPPLSECYAAAKAGLIGFTQSLRASYDGTGVSASAVCPGFIAGAGMFEDRIRRDGVRAPALLGTSAPDAVARAVVKAIRRDAPEILVTPGPARLLAAFAQLAPRFPGRMIRLLKIRDLYRASGRLPSG